MSFKCKLVVMKKIFFISKNAQRSTTPNVQKATFKNAACKPRVETYPLQHCTLATLHASLGQNLSRQWDRRDLLTGCQVSRVLASSNGGSYVDYVSPVTMAASNQFPTWTVSRL